MVSLAGCAYQPAEPLVGNTVAPGSIDARVAAPRMPLAERPAVQTVHALYRGPGRVRSVHTLAGIALPEDPSAPVQRAVIVMDDGIVQTLDTTALVAAGDRVVVTPDGWVLQLRERS